MSLKLTRRQRWRLMFRVGLLLGVVVFGALYATVAASPDASGGDAQLSAAAQRLLLAESDASQLDNFPPDVFSREEQRQGWILLHCLGCCWMFVALAVVVDEFFVPALEVIIDRFSIRHDVAGATFMAAGGSAPELFTSFLGVFVSKSNVGFGTIVGSAVFNVLFVIAMCAIFARETLELTWWPLARDCSYYALSLLVLAIFFGVVSKDEIEWWESSILFLMYIGYCVLMSYNQTLKSKVDEWLARRKNREAGRALEREESVSGVRLHVLPGDGEGDENKVQFIPAPAGASGRRRLSEDGATSFDRPTTFRAGILQLLLSEKSMLETAGIYVVQQLKGDMRAAFDALDLDHSGYLEHDEIKGLLHALTGEEPSHSDVDACLAAIDTNNDGRISFEEFSLWYVASEARIYAELTSAFRHFDRQGTGYLGRGDILELLRTLSQHEGGGGGGAPHEAATADDVDRMFHDLDANHDGRITQDEFSQWYKKSIFWQKKKALAEAYAREASEAEEGIDLSWPEGTMQRIVYVITFPLVAPMVLTLPNMRDKANEHLFPLTFIGSIIWIGIFSYCMVWMASVIGVALGIPPEVMGLTFLAAGTSIPDLLSSVIVAQQGHGDMAVSSSIGSNVFDVLVGLPVPWLIWSLAHGGDPIDVTADTLFLSLILLFAMLVSVIVLIAWSQWKLTKTLAAMMIFLYAAFVTQDLLRAFDQV